MQIADKYIRRWGAVLCEGEYIPDISSLRQNFELYFSPIKKKKLMYCTCLYNIFFI